MSACGTAEPRESQQAADSTQQRNSSHEVYTSTKQQHALTVPESAHLVVAAFLRENVSGVSIFAVNLSISMVSGIVEAPVVVFGGGGVQKQGPFRVSVFSLGESHSTNIQV